MVASMGSNGSYGKYECQAWKLTWGNKLSERVYAVLAWQLAQLECMQGFKVTPWCILQVRLATISVINLFDESFSS